MASDSKKDKGGLNVYHYYENPYSQDVNNRGLPNEFYDFRQISMPEAMTIAQGLVPGRVVKIELEQEHGMWVYELDIITSQGAKYEVKVDINTGEIVKVELD